MQLSIPQISYNLAKLDFWTPQDKTFWWLGGGHKSQLQPLGPHGGLLVAPLFNKEANISPPGFPVCPMEPHGSRKQPKKINILSGLGQLEFLLALEVPMGSQGGS